MTVYGQAVADFAAKLLGYPRGFGACQAIGFLDRDGNLVASIVYHNWVPENGVIELSAASLHRRWLTRARLSAIFEYPFEQMKCRLAVARTSEHNATARRIWRSLGADEYVIPELRGPSEAEAIYLLHAEKWLSGKFQKKLMADQDIGAKAR